MSLTLAEVKNIRDNASVLLNKTQAEVSQLENEALVLKLYLSKTTGGTIGQGNCKWKDCKNYTLARQIGNVLTGALFMNVQRSWGMPNSPVCNPTDRSQSDCGWKKNEFFNIIENKLPPKIVLLNQAKTAYTEAQNEYSRMINEGTMVTNLNIQNEVKKSLDSSNTKANITTLGFVVIFLIIAFILYKTIF
jgi:hypothetical protein